MGQQNSSRRGAQDINHKSPLLLPTDNTVALEQVSTSQLKMLALHAGEDSVGIRDRGCLLASIERTHRAEVGTSWLVQNAKGVSYQRAVGAMVSLAGELYVFGGFSTSRFLEMTGILREDDPFMVKLNKDTHMWEPVTLAGAPGASWCQGFVNAKAVVHQGKMYFIGSARYDEDHMRILDSQTHRWSVLSLDKTPTAYGRVLLDAYDDQLIQFGGCYREGYYYVEPEDALWTFDISQQTWQKRDPTGPLPIPDLALGLAVANGCAYVLANPEDHVFMPDRVRRMEVYELNLETWHWRLLPCKGEAAFCATKMTPVVVQGQWLVFGGFPVPAEDEMTKMFAFDLSTLSWSLLDLTGTPLQHRMSYHAACHNDSLVVVGGLLPSPDRVSEDYGAPQTVQVIKLTPNAREADLPDTSIMRYNMVRDISSMFKRSELADTVLAVAGHGQQWRVHRIVLASASRVFREAFKSEEEEQVMVHKLELTDVSPESVSLMLDFLYGDFKASLTFAEAVGLFCTSHKYDVTELQQQCERALVALMSQQTIYELENLVTQYHSPALAQACRTFMEQANKDRRGYIDAQRMRSSLLRAKMLTQDKPDRASFAHDDDVQMYEATDAGTAADHEPAMGQSSSSADGTSISQDQSVNNNVAALQPAAMQEGTRISRPQAGLLAEDKPDRISFALDGLLSHALTDLDDMESCSDDTEEVSMPAETDDGGHSPVGDSTADIDMVGSSGREWASQQTGQALDAGTAVATSSQHLESHQDVQMYEASEAATAADHEPAMGLSSSSADGTLIPQNQGVSDDVAALEPAALQEDVHDHDNGMPSSGFSLGRFGWGLAKGAAKVTAATLCTVAIAALADKHTCHAAQKRHQIPSLPRFR